MIYRNFQDLEMVMKDIKHTKEDFKEWLNEKITCHLSRFPPEFSAYAPTQNLTALLVKLENAQ